MEEGTVKAENDNGLEIHEADLEKHLTNGQDTGVGNADDEAKPPSKKDGETKEEDKGQPGRVIVRKNDYQFNQALTLLKGLSLLQERKQ